MNNWNPHDTSLLLSADGRMKLEVWIREAEKLLVLLHQDGTFQVFKMVADCINANGDLRIALDKIMSHIKK